MDFVFCNRNIDEQILEQNKWLKYLYLTRENQINLERLASMEELQKENHVLRYVERTLEMASTHSELSESEKKYVTETLKWCEVAKCGMPEQRTKWSESGLNLEIHNEASARIYDMDAEDNSQDKNIIRTLIFTHGLLGQYIRGETGFEVHRPLAEMISAEIIGSESLAKVLMALNHCIIGGVSENLWNDLKDEVNRLVAVICSGDIESENMSVLERLKRLFSAYKHVDGLDKEEEALYEELFEGSDLWYAESALDTFSRKELITVFKLIKEKAHNIRHISFYKMSRTLTYDYEGHRKINVYKKRIVEVCLREYAENIEDKKSKEHVNVSTEIVGDTLYFDVCFTRVCDSLVNFCVEAERSGIMTYEKSIQTIFDLFGFRRDIFDRLNNEEKYLETMNNAKDSTKLQIMNYVVGDCVVDVGSGGGVLLDVLEKNYPDKTIIGTDISTNVIEKLNQKIEEEGHHYKVLRHNFVEGPIDCGADTILFSSILHEVYSYTQWEGEQFNIEAVKAALANAYNSLPAGGRIVIRDGIMADSDKICSVRFRSPEGVSFAQNYIRDFKGLKTLRRADDADKWQENKVSLNGDVLTADVNFIREALYTYTWGNESYAQEVQEQFGYFTYQGYIDFLKELGMEIIYSDSFTEKGYPDNLNPLVELMDGLTWEELPSTCIIAAQK